MSERTFTFYGNSGHSFNHQRYQPQVSQVQQLPGLPSSSQYTTRHQHQSGLQQNEPHPIFVPRKVPNSHLNSQILAFDPNFRVHSSFPVTSQPNHQQRHANNFDSQFHGDIRSRHFYSNPLTFSKTDPLTVTPNHSATQSSSFPLLSKSPVNDGNRSYAGGYQSLYSSSTAGQVNPRATSSTQFLVHPPSNRVPVSVEIHAPLGHYHQHSLKSRGKDKKSNSFRKKLRSSLPTTLSSTSSSASQAMTVFSILGSDHTTSSSAIHSNVNPLKHSITFGSEATSGVTRHDLLCQQQEPSHSKQSNGSTPSLAFNGFAVGIKESPSNPNLETIVEELSPSSLSKTSVRPDMNPGNSSNPFPESKGSLPPRISFVPPSPSGSFSFPSGVSASFPNTPFKSPVDPGNCGLSSSLENNLMTSGINYNRNTKVMGRDLLSVPLDPSVDPSLEEIESFSCSLDGSRLPGRLERLDIEEGPINLCKTRRKSSILSMDRLFRHKIGSLPESNSRQSIVSHPDDNELRVTNFNRLTDLRKILNPEEEKEDLWAAFWARFQSCDWFDWNLNNAAKLITMGVFVVTIILIVKAIISSGSI